MPDVSSKKFMEQMLQEHNELREVIIGVREFLEDSRPDVQTPGYHTWAVGLSEHLLKLHDKLFRHFRSEDSGAMMKDLADRFPRSVTRVERLQGQHGEILTALRGLMDATLRYSEGNRPIDPRMRKRVEGLLHSIDEHEQDETDLIQRMLYNDLGTGD